MVFRRDNKVDSYQRQMSALRTQLGTAGEADDQLADIPDIDDATYDEGAYRQPTSARDQDAGAYSFGSYPSGSAAPQRTSDYDDEPPALPAMPPTDASMSIIAEDASLKGEINAERSIQIFGQFEGTMTAREDVWIAEKANVNATINAQRVIVSGVVAGTITATSRFETLSPGRVNADVTAPVSVIHEGAVINGSFRIGSSDNPTEQRDRGGSPAVIQRRSRPGS